MFFFEKQGDVVRNPVQFQKGLIRVDFLAKNASFGNAVDAIIKRVAHLDTTDISAGRYHFSWVRGRP